MRKIVLAFSFAFATISFAQAQSFALGLKAGANLDKIDGIGFRNGFNLGYQVGAFAEVDLSKKLGIQPEILFSQTNTKTASDFNNVYQNIGNGAAAPDGEKVKLNYLQIPVLLRYNATKLLTIHAGPQFSILTNENQNLFQNGQEAFKSGDISAVLGLQLNLNPLRIYGRYNVGVTNISDVASKEKWSSQQIQLGVGFKLL